jgi:hypothetical protein
MTRKAEKPEFEKIAFNALKGSLNPFSEPYVYAKTLVINALNEAYTAGRKAQMEEIEQGKLCKPLSEERIKDLIRRHIGIKGGEVWFEQLADDLHQAQFKERV